MSTIAPDPTVTEAVRPADRVPMSRLVQVELRKMVDTRAGLWLFIAMGLLTAAAVTLFLIFAEPEDVSFGVLAAVCLTPQGFLLPILGILLITSEWSQRTGLVTFTLEPSRMRVVVAKTLAALIVGAVAVVLLLGVAAVGNVIGGTFLDADASWDLGGAELGQLSVLQLSAIVQGLAFGMVLMNSAAAITLYFVLPIASSIVVNIIGTNVLEAAPWFDIGTAQEPLFSDTGLTGEEWAQLGVASTIWIILPLVLGIIRLLRAELKSA
jgi:ABC-type transport system involved in multi-copper enzyme maturation permease subunit